MNPNDLKIFIITYDRPEMLARQLDSVLAQTVRPDVVTVLDNGTNPETRRVVDARAAQGARYVNTRERGAAGNMLTAQELCQDAKYVAAFHDDDMLHPQYLGYVMKVIAAHPGVALVVGDCVMQDARQFTLPDATPHGRGLLLNGRDWASLIFNVSTRKYPFAVYEVERFRRLDIKAISEACGRACDLPILMEAVADGEAAFLTFPFAVYGVHPGQDSYNPATFPDVRCFANLNACFRKHMGDDLRTMAGFSYAFRCLRVLKSDYKRRGKKTLSRREFLGYAREVGAIPPSARFLRPVSNHLTQDWVQKLVKHRLFARLQDLV